VTYTMAVIEVETGAEYELPADAVTLEAASARDGAPAAAERPGHVALLPLAFRGRDAVFYLGGHRWPALEGRPLRVAPRGRALRS
jgi:hypothetical protein